MSCLIYYETPEVLKVSFLDPALTKTVTLNINMISFLKI